MRLVKDLVLRAWQERKAVVGRDAAEAERSAKTIQQKVDRLDEAFIYAKAIDLDTYERQRDKLRQELALTLCRAPRTCGSRPRSISATACSGCSSRTESCSMESGLFEPA